MKPSVDLYDVLIIDEYQDIETEMTILLNHIQSFNPSMQIIVVGDMQQKIYDKTNLNVIEFIRGFLGEHIETEFTQCFRISAKLAESLGRIWKKKIVGVNSNCKVCGMTIPKVIEFLSNQKPQDILCLGSRTGDLSKALNKLEEEYPETFNKETVFASIFENDSLGASTPSSDTAIFTTFDSSKGLERRICVVFDYTESYWQTRISKPNQSYEILRNIFCVAASRGKSIIIFANNDEKLLSEATISTRVDENLKQSDVDISSMFDFKFREDIETCFSLLKKNRLMIEDQSIIEVKNTDGMIDLSPCIGKFQEALFFKKYNIDIDIEQYFLLHENTRNLWSKRIKDFSLEEKILFLVSLETNQERYRTQVELPIVDDNASNLISDRLFTRFKHDENVQVQCSISFSDKKYGEKIFSANGIADVVKDDVVYELKFVSELSHEHFLQCACYIVALNLKKGILWNVRDNTVYEIEVPDKKSFLDSVVNAITKNQIKTYCEPYVIKHTQTRVVKPEGYRSIKKQLKIDFSQFKVGVTVFHKIFGSGTIIEYIYDKNNHSVKINFENGLTRKFDIEYAVSNNLLHIKSDKKGKPTSKIESEEEKFEKGYDEVKNLFEQQTTIVRDRYKNRWVKCEICGEIKRDYDFLSYGGENHVNLGQCRECSVRMRNQK